jgi:hypothetical protein
MFKLGTKSCVIVVSLFLTACADHNQLALDLGAPPIKDDKTITSLRAIQSRSFTTLKKDGLVQASAATLQDLGFTVKEVSNEYGVLVGSKERDAVEGGQVAIQAILVILSALGGRSHNATYDETQKINTNNHGQLWKADLITETEIYQQFFEKLSKSAFFEENKL